MQTSTSSLIKKLVLTTIVLSIILVLTLLLGVVSGSSQFGLKDVWELLSGQSSETSVIGTIIWQIRLPRTLVAALVGGALSLGGLIFQALLRNPLAEPYILGISGGAAIGAISGILMGLARFPGVTFTAFMGSMATLAAILLMSSGRAVMKKDALLLSGVMINAFCSAVIMFLVSITQDARLHNIMFWLMGDLGQLGFKQVMILALTLSPFFFVVFALAHQMNLLLMGKDIARTMGVNVEKVSLFLLIMASLIVSTTVSYCGLIGFVGLVIPHLLRLLLGPDHRILIPACLLGGGAYLVICDIFARVLPQQGEMPAGVITALIGAPLFILLLRRSRQ